MPLSIKVLILKISDFARNYAYVAGHPMKPHRIRMAHSLIMNYGLYTRMEIYVSLTTITLPSNLTQRYLY